MEIPVEKGTGAFSILLSDNDEAIDDLAYEAVQDALREHKRKGESIVVWRDGKVVTLPPEEIPVDLPEESRAA